MRSRINVDKYEQFLNYLNEGIFYYENGRIWRTKRVNSHGKIVDLEKPILTSTLTTNGYRRVHFNKISVYEHTFIYAIFNGIDALKEIECIDHINGIKHDNIPSNLEGVTIKENNDRAKANGLLRPLRNEENGHCKLTNVEVALIRELYKRGANQYEIAEIAKVSQGHISEIVRNKRRVV